MTNKPRLLFTGGGGAGSEALARLLAPTYDVHFTDADYEAKPPTIAAQQWHQIPMATARNFTDSITKLCHQLGINLFIPTVDEELLPVAQLAHSSGFETLLPHERFVARHLDKLASNQFLWQAGLPAPHSIAANLGRLTFPCIVKPLSGRGSRHVAIVHSEAELQAHILLSRMAISAFVIQELIVGQEFTVMMCANKQGVLHAIVPVLVGRKKGITLRAHTAHDPAVIAACRAIHTADPVSGCYNIQLVKTTDGQVKPFEINPRISTTACLGLAAGVDFISIYLNGTSISSQDHLMEFRHNLGLKRSWYNEFVIPA